MTAAAGLAVTTVIGVLSKADLLTSASDAVDAARRYRERLAGVAVTVLPVVRLWQQVRT